MGLSEIFADETLPPQGAGHLAVIVPLRVRFSGGVFVKGVLVGPTVPPPLAILALFFFRFRQAVSTTGGRRRRGESVSSKLGKNLRALHDPKGWESPIDLETPKIQTVSLKNRWFSKLFLI